MSNGFGSLYVGSSGLRGAQNGLNILSNNLANIATPGYVRRRVIYEDDVYNSFERVAVSKQQTGMGVNIGDVIHARDFFLDQSYRKESSRASFYTTGYDAALEVQTQLQETNGEAFKDAIADLYGAFAEYAKAPGDTVNQNLVIQKSELFLSRSEEVYDGLKNYQYTINTKIRNDVNRINDLGKEIAKLNKEITRIEAGKRETAMDLRDLRDKDLDELSSLAKISVRECVSGAVKVRLEGSEFIDEVNYSEIKLKEDKVTGFLDPYWKDLSDPLNEQYYMVFNPTDADPALNSDMGEVKSLLLARGDGIGNYTDIKYLTSTDYDKGIGKSIVKNAQAELDKLVNTIVTRVNDLLCPNKNFNPNEHGGVTEGIDEDGKKVVLTADTKIFDEKNTPVGGDYKLPPDELFVRSGSKRYKKITLKNGDKVYTYQDENIHDLSTCYSLNSLNVNKDLTENPSHLPHLQQNGNIDYTLGAKINAIWEVNEYTLNPSDVSPTTLLGFYTKYIGELATTGSVYKTTSESVEGTKKAIDHSRNGVVGVSSDEELVSMVKYQNAYNASSRYINVVNEMIEYLLSSLYSK